jgi:CheY-like chemotaxis protein
MKILIVEDNEDRLNWFATEFKGTEELALATTAEKGKYYVNLQKWDVIFLDHDLGGRVYVNSADENTGYQVAKEIVVSINKDTPVIVHSYNPAGVKNIMGVLKHAEAIPFGMFDKTILGESKSEISNTEIGRIVPSALPVVQVKKEKRNEENKSS